MLAAPKLKNVLLFQDGAVLSQMELAAKNPLISGFTTNPTLMAKAGISDYQSFAEAAISLISEKSISFEVFSDDLENMEREARKIASWGGNTYVKIPITTTNGSSTFSLIERLSGDGISLNITAIFTEKQVELTSKAVCDGARAIISVFAGRIADTGIDPVPLMRHFKEMISGDKNQELLWASPREVLNVYQADECGCDIITATPDILSKLKLAGKDLEEYSRETVKMFYDDAKKAGFTLE